MRKRMIAWLLCLCVTLTAAPELLLASVPAESVTAEQTTELAETELAETETIQTESTKTETPEGTEATEESTETEVTEAAETEEATGTEEGTETEVMEKVTETEVTETFETEVTEEPETEDTEEQETENTETEEIETETEEVDLTDDMRNASSGDEITRIAWVQELVTLFELSVEEDNYPDNYYSDISTDDSYYRDIMVACEFGMIDLEAGEAFCPENAVTREFAVQSLNAMLGFVLDSETYTYSDTADVTYQDDAQIAVNRGWVTLTDGAFLPEQPITTQEHDAMIADATQVLADAQIDTGTQNSCSFASNVVVVPEGTEVSLDGEGNITIENCPVSITAGTTFAVYADGIAMAYKAESVKTVGTTTYIKATDAEDGAVLNVNQQGEIEVDLTEFVPADEETYVTNGIEVTESKTRGISYDGKTLKADKTISLADNVTATVNIVISDIKVSYSLKNNDYYFSVSGDLEYSCNVKGDLFADIDHTLTIGAVPLGDIGMLTLALEYSLSGEATLTVEKEFEAGFAYSNGFRVIGQSQKKSFSFAAEANFSTGVILSAKASLGVVSGGVDAKAGARLNMKAVNYSSGKPSQCISQASYLYASVGANTKIGIGILSRTFEKRLDIWDVNNSPIRVYYHYEDGVLCTKCTRGKEFASKGGWTSYYTSPSSRYFNPAGVGSYVDATGATVPIYTYTLDDANRATITGYNGSAMALYIPGEIDGHEVVAIGRGAFKNRTDLKTVMIPDSVENIGIEAFSNCTQLANISWSKNLEKIGENAFYNCDSLQNIEIPKSLKDVYATYDSIYIPNGVFNECSNLKTVNFEEGSTIIADALFRGCDGIEEVTIPDTITEIYGYAFADCKNLKNINISDSVTVIGESVFAGDTSIKEINLPDSITKFGARIFSGCNSLENIVIPDSVINIGIGAFSECKNLKSVKLSRGLEKIGENAFYNCDSLQSIEIPKSLKDVYATYDSIYIPNGVFNGCSNLKTVNFEDGSTVIADALFRGCDGLEEVTIPDTITEIYGYVFADCKNLNNINISDSVTVIGESGFEGDTSIKEINLPDSITKLGARVFSGCDRLESIVIPDSVANIGIGAFSECKNLKSVKLSRGLEKIGENAFYNCDSLQSVEIPKSLKDVYATYDSIYTPNGVFNGCSNLKTINFEEGCTVIADALFRGCDGIEKVTIPKTVTIIKNHAFNNCTNLKVVEIPSGVTEIGESVFGDCTNLQKVILPDTVNSMGTNIFYNCINLTEVHLPNIRQNIGANTFYNCKKLTTVNFPSTLKAIRQNAFYGCESLTQAVLPTGLETIEGNAFYGCKSLKKVVTPDTITSIGNSAFYGCEALTDVTLGSGLKAINSQTFYGCTVLPSIVIPYNVTSIGDSAFVNCTKLTSVTVPRKTTSIASNAFSYPKKMTMYGPSGCYAQDYAAQKGIKFVKQDIHATSVKLNITNKTVDRCEDFQLTATIAPNNFTDEVVWTSSNEDVATVSENGYVETYQGGTAVITVTVGGKKASCNVTVRQLVNWMDFEEYEVSLKAGQTHQLSLEISPSNATDKRVDYVSSNPSVATVSASGLVTAKAKGETKITATAKDGSGEYAYCYVTVTGSVKPSGISLDQTSAKVKKGKTLTLKATVTPGNATNKKVTWKSSNTKIATVDAKGVVTAKAPGKVTITATAAGNTSCKATCSITVPYNIVYKLDKGKNNSKNPDSYYNQKITLKNPSRKGYEFKGWYTDSKFKNKITTISKNSKKNYTLYAKWAKVKVGKATLSSAKNNKSKQILVKYKKVSGAKGYEISYSTDKNFKKGVTAKTTDKTSYTIKKLKAKKTYYVRVRAYKVDSAGKKVYGKYSSVKKVKISK